MHEGNDLTLTAEELRAYLSTACQAQSVFGGNYVANKHYGYFVMLF